MTMRWIVPILFSGVLACGGQGTTGKRVVLHTKIATDLAADRSFVTGVGWRVQLDTAMIATGPLYYYDGEPAFTQADPAPRSLIRRLLDALSPVREAYAHPGHYVAGNAKGEQLKPFSVDLMAGSAGLPDGDGVSGVFRSATFSFAAPTAGPVASMLEGHVAVARGRATKDGKTVHFSAAAELGDVEKTAKDGQVTGCVFKTTDVEADGSVLVTVKPKVWFNLVDFAELPEGSEQAPSPLPPNSTARVGFALGLTQLSAYELAYQTP